MDSGKVTSSLEEGLCTVAATGRGMPGGNPIVTLFTLNHIISQQGGETGNWFWNIRIAMRRY
jgi:hypothetical protein